MEFSLHHPIDLTEPGQAQRLASFIWPDQPERLARLQAAQAAARGWMLHESVKLEALPAAAFVARELQALHQGAATVLMHSVVWQYIAAAEQALIEAAVAQAAVRASAGAPLAWLRLEPRGADGKVELRCRLWPGGHDHLLAQAHPHAAQIDWLAGASEPALRLAAAPAPGVAP